MVSNRKTFESDKGSLKLKPNDPGMSKMSGSCKIPVLAIEANIRLAAKPKPQEFLFSTSFPFFPLLPPHFSVPFITETTSPSSKNPPKTPRPALLSLLLPLLCDVLAGRAFLLQTEEPGEGGERKATVKFACASHRCLNWEAHTRKRRVNNREPGALTVIWRVVTMEHLQLLNGTWP